MKNARQTALDVLLKVHRADAYANLALDAALRESRLDSRDRAFAASLVYSCLERQTTIDFQLCQYLTQPLSKLRPEVLIILRLGTCQLLFLEKVPQSAAVNSSVTLAKQNRCAYATGLVNAVLRNIARNGLSLPESADLLQDWSVRYSCPTALLGMLLDAYGEEHTLGILQHSFGPAPLVARVNRTRIRRSVLLERLATEGVCAQAHPALEHAIVLEHTGAISALPAFQEGLFHMQSTASQLCCQALDANPGDTILDLCAAPGGKSFTLAQEVGSQGQVHSFDLHPARVGLIAQGAKRLGILNIIARPGDAAIYNPDIPKADKVLCDVPCSGYGMLRRKPEIRHKNPLDIDKLPDLQYRILCNATRYLTNSGLILYATCTVNPAENEAVCRRFLTAHTNFRPVLLFPALTRHAPDQIGLTLLPHLHGCDGFYLALLQHTERR